MSEYDGESVWLNSLTIQTWSCNNFSDIIEYRFLRLFIPKSLVNKPLIIQPNSYVHRELQFEIKQFIIKNIPVSTGYP